MKLNAEIVSAYAQSVPNGVHLNVTVQDKEMREHVDPGFNGYERVFALIPRLRGDHVAWERHDLNYVSTGYSRLPQGAVIDTHALLVGNLDEGAVRKYGIAFGMDIEGAKGRQTVWCQTPDDNFKVQGF